MLLRGVPDYYAVCFSALLGKFARVAQRRTAFQLCNVGSSKTLLRAPTTATPPAAGTPSALTTARRDDEGHEQHEEKPCEAL
jgi:hypothetical protein